MIMKHKWLVLLLCVAMLLTFVVAGCATKPDDEAQIGRASCRERV